MAEEEQFVDDLPNDVAEAEAPVIIDENHATYTLQEKGNAYVYVEKLLVPKKFYIPAKLGQTRSRRYFNQRLIKEDGYTDIGGGKVTFKRHYARIPDSWFDFEIKTPMVYSSYSYQGLNFDSGYGSYPHGYPYSYNMKQNRNFVTKATRYYIKEAVMNLYTLSKYTVSGDWSNGNYTYPDGLADNVLVEDADGNPLYPARLFINEPRTVMPLGDNTEIAIAPDKIVLWQPGIYEITRYTASVNFKGADPYGRIPIVLRWIPGANVTQEELNVTRVDFGKTFNYTNGARQNRLYWQTDLTSAAITEGYNIRSRVLSDAGLKVINILSGSSTFDTSVLPYTDETIAFTYDGSSVQIGITLVIGKE